MIADDKIVAGRVTGLLGIKGWVKVYSYTQPQDNITQYDPWYLRLGDHWRTIPVVTSCKHGKTIIAKFRNYDTRDQAAKLLGVELAIERDQLEPLSEGEYYWVDLIGLSVINMQGCNFGEVKYLIETGANDVLVVQGKCEHLIPFVQEQVIKVIDLKAGFIQVDWDNPGC